MSEELKPCPFCGCKRINIIGSHQMLRDGFLYCAKIRCPECEIRTEELMSFGEDLEQIKCKANDVLLGAWNKRT